MKYDVNFSCGHEATIELFGKNEERHRRIDYLEKFESALNAIKSKKKLKKA